MQSEKELIKDLNRINNTSNIKDIVKTKNNDMIQEYNRGISDAWKSLKWYFDKTMNSMSKEYHILFEDISDIVNRDPFSAMDQIRDMQFQERSEQIKVGDEVIHIFSNQKGVVLCVNQGVQSNFIVKFNDGFESSFPFPRGLKHFKIAGKNLKSAQQDKC